LDEHISPALVRKLGEKGLYAEAVAHVGLSGEPDEHIWNYALEHDRKSTVDRALAIPASALDRLAVCASSYATICVIYL
jgi:predicted nuclease of predicted toxin-antitoxin system